MKDVIIAGLIVGTRQWSFLMVRHFGFTQDKLRRRAPTTVGNTNSDATGFDIT